MTNEDYRYKLCNAIPGVTVKDVENVMKAFARQYIKEQSEEDEEREAHPEKYDPQPFKPSESRNDEGFKRSDSKNVYGTYSPEDVQRLMAATSVTQDDKRDEPPKKGNYINYAKEEVEALFRCDYNPEHFKYLHKKKEPNRDE